MTNYIAPTDIKRPIRSELYGPGFLLLFIHAIFVAALTFDFKSISFVAGVALVAVPTIMLLGTLAIALYNRRGNRARIAKEVTKLHRYLKTHHGIIIDRKASLELLFDSATSFKVDDRTRATLRLNRNTGMLSMETAETEVTKRQLNGDTAAVDTPSTVKEATKVLPAKLFV